MKYFIVSALAMVVSMGTVNGAVNCDIKPGMSESQCSQKIERGCAIEWLGLGCCKREKNGVCKERFDDGGCKINNFCSFQCSDKCNAYKSRCKWNGEKCVAKKTKKPTKKPTSAPTRKPIHSEDYFEYGPVYEYLHPIFYSVEFSRGSRYCNMGTPGSAYSTWGTPWYFDGTSNSKVSCKIPRKLRKIIQSGKFEYVARVHINDFDYSCCGGVFPIFDDGNFNFRSELMPTQLMFELGVDQSGISTFAQTFNFATNQKYEIQVRCYSYDCIGYINGNPTLSQTFKSVSSLLIDTFDVGVGKSGGVEYANGNIYSICFSSDFSCPKDY